MKSKKEFKEDNDKRRSKNSSTNLYVNSLETINSQETLKFGVSQENISQNKSSQKVEKSNNKSKLRHYLSSSDDEAEK